MLRTLFDFVYHADVDVFDLEYGQHHRRFLLSKFEWINQFLRPDVSYNYMSIIA